MTESAIYPVPESFKQHTHNNLATYNQRYRESISDPEGFWQKQAQCIDWLTPFTEVKDVSYAIDDLHIRWFYDGELNVIKSGDDWQTKVDSWYQFLVSQFAIPGTSVQNFHGSQYVTPPSDEPKVKSVW